MPKTALMTDFHMPIEETEGLVKFFILPLLVEMANSARVSVGPSDLAPVLFWISARFGSRTDPEEKRVLWNLFHNLRVKLEADVPDLPDVEEAPIDADSVFSR